MLCCVRMMGLSETMMWICVLILKWQVLLKLLRLLTLMWVVSVLVEEQVFWLMLMCVWISLLELICLGV